MAETQRCVRLLPDPGWTRLACAYQCLPVPLASEHLCSVPGDRCGTCSQPGWMMTMSFPSSKAWLAVAKALGEDRGETFKGTKALISGVVPCSHQSNKPPLHRRSLHIAAHCSALGSSQALPPGPRAAQARLKASAGKEEAAGPPQKRVCGTTQMGLEPTIPSSGNWCLIL